MKAALAWALLTLVGGPTSSAAPCNSSTGVEPYIVDDAAAALALIDLVNCSDGFFEVEWVGSVTVSETIRISGSTTVNIFGRNSAWSEGSASSAPPVIDGKGEIRLLEVDGATLHLTDLELANGNSTIGAAIDATDSIVTVSRCSFSDNLAVHGGGGVYLDSSTLGIINTSFTNNSAHLGGGLYTENWSNVTVFGNTVFKDNMAYYGGGVILDAWSNMLLAGGNISFVNNGAKNDTGADYTNAGGAIYAGNSTITDLAQTRFEGNEAVFGGGVYLLESTIHVVGTTTFAANNVTYIGAGLYAYLSLVHVHGEAVFFENAAEYGAAVFLVDGTLLVDGTVYFGDNHATNSGGAIYGERSAVNITGSAEFELNSAIFGGAVRLWSLCDFHISGSVSFSYNVADQGGGVWISAGSTMTTVRDATFFLNNGRDGGAMVIYDSNAKFMEGTATFFNNTAAEGGVIILFGNGTVSIANDANFSHNSAVRGGAILLLEGASAHFTGNVTMSHNTAASSGGAMHCEATEDLLINGTGCRFASNYAGSSGGAVTMLSAGLRSNPVIIEQCVFSDNEALDAGGSVFVGGGDVEMYRSTFTSNTAGRSGGAILASGVVGLDRCLFEDNRARAGPAVSNTVSVGVTNTRFIDNALYCAEGSFLDWTEDSAYLTACDSCPEECNMCTVSNPQRVLQCEITPDHASSIAEDDTLETLQLDRGYWRDSNLSKEIVECYETKACGGGVEEYCEAGYTGPYCAVCEENYARGLGYTCSVCSGERRNAAIAIVVVVALAVVGMVLCSVCFLRSATDTGEQHNRDVLSCGGLSLSDRGMSFSGRGSRSLSRVRSHVQNTRAFQGLKIILVSWQIITQFSEVASVTYPEIYAVFLKYIDAANLNLGWMVSTGCLIDTSFYDNLLVATLGPLVILVLVATSYSFARGRCLAGDRDAHATIKRRHVSVLFWVSFLIYATVSSAIFQTFACDDLDNGQSFLRADHRVECHDGRHRFFMAYAALMTFIYPFGIPFCYALALYRSRKILKSPDREEATEVENFKDLWRPYRPQVFYYEVVECLRRVMLSGIVVFVFPNTAGQVATSFLMALFFFATLMVLDPYENHLDAWLGRVGHAVVMLSMFVALLQKVDVAGEDMSSQDVFSGVLVVANCGMVLVVGAEACGTCYVAVRETRAVVRPNSQVDLMARVEALPSWDSPQGVEMAEMSRSGQNLEPSPPPPPLLRLSLEAPVDEECPAGLRSGHSNGDSASLTTENLLDDPHERSTE